MSETTSTATETAEVTTSTETTETTTSETKTAEWYESELAKVRQEAAANRVKGREKAEAVRAEVATEFEAKLAEATSAHETATSELSSARIAMAKLQAALSSPEVLKTALTKATAETPGGAAKYISNFASLLQGNTEEEIAAHAATVKDLFGVTPTPEVETSAVDPSQGMGGSRPSGDDFGSFVMNLLNK